MRIPLIAGIISVAYTDAIAREHRVACYAYFIANSKIRDCIGITKKAAPETLLGPRAGALPRAVPVPEKAALPRAVPAPGKGDLFPAILTLEKHLSIRTITTSSPTMMISGMNMMITMTRMTDSWTMTMHGTTIDYLYKDDEDNGDYLDEEE